MSEPSGICVTQSAPIVLHPGAQPRRAMKRGTALRVVKKNDSVGRN